MHSKPVSAGQSSPVPSVMRRRRPLAAAGLLVLALTSQVVAANPTLGADQHGPTPGRVTATPVDAVDRSRPLWGFYGPQSEFKRDIASAPLAPNSYGLVSNLSRQVYSRWNGVASFNVDAYNLGFYAVPAGQPRANVIWDNCRGISMPREQLVDPRYGAHFASVPIPDDAVPARGRDGALAIWSRSSDQLWEFWRARKESDGWHACWGGRIDRFSTSAGFFPGRMGLSASGLSVSAGVLGINETRRGRIDHAVRIGIPEVANWSEVSYPAQRSDGGLRAGTPNAIRIGQRFRLDRSMDVSSLGLSPIAAAVARAAQTYGLIVADRSGAVTFSTESGNSSPGGDPWPALMRGVPRYQIFAGFPWGRLQALPLDYGKP